MLHRLLNRLSYANVVATLALFIALGGTSYAALKLPKNSVGSTQIKTGAVHTGEIANPKVKPMIDEAIRRIRKAGKAPGILTPNEADAKHWLGCGGLFVAVGADVGILARGAEALAAKFK